LQTLFCVDHLEKIQTGAQSLPRFFRAMTLLLSTFVCLVVSNLSVCQAGCWWGYTGKPKVFSIHMALLDHENSLKQQFV